MELEENNNSKNINTDYEKFDSANNFNRNLLSFTEWLFNAISLMVPSTFISPLSAAILIIWSFTQLLTLILSLFYFGDYQHDKTFQILTYTRIYPGIEVLNSFTLYVFSYVITGVILVVLSINTAYNLALHSQAHFSHYIPGLYWTALLPILEILISPFKTLEPSSPSFLPKNSLATIFIVLSSIFLLFYLQLAIFSTLTCTYSQLHKNDPFAHFPWYFELTYTFFRILILLEFLFLEIYPIRILTIGLLLAYLISILIYVYPYYHPTVSIAFCTGIGILLSGCFIIILKYWCLTFDLKLKNDIKLTIVLAIIIGIAFYWLIYKWYTFLLAIKGPKTVYEHDAWFHILINSVNQGITFSNAQEYYIKYHFSKTPKEIPKNELGSFKSDLKSNKFNNDSKNSTLNCINEIFEQYENDKMFYKEDIHFLMQLASAYLHIKNNSQFSYTIIQEIDLLCPNFINLLSIHMLKLEILHSVSTQVYKSSKKSNMNNKYEQVIQFEAENSNMILKMSDQTTLRLEFWSDLKGKPSLNKLHSLGLQMIQLNQQIISSWKKLLSIYPHHIGLLRIYKSYYKNIVGDKEELNELRNRIKIALMEKTSKGYDQMFSARTSIIIISANQKIVRASRNTEDLLSYRIDYLHGHSITTLMPHFIACQHQQFIEGFYKKGTVSGKYIETFGLDRNSYLVPVKIMQKQFYSLSLGMLYIAAIETTKSKQFEQYIITDNQGMVGGITRKLAKKLKVSPTVFVEKKIGVEKLCETSDGQPLFSKEGEVNLKFLINQSEQDKNERKAYLSKCEISSIKYSTGTIIRIIKVLKELDSLEKNERKNKKKIDKSMINSVAVIMKAVRKMRCLLIRAKQRNNLLDKDKSQVFPNELPSPKKHRMSCTELIHSPLQVLKMKKKSVLFDIPENGEVQGILGQSFYKQGSTRDTKNKTSSLTNLRETTKGMLLKATEKITKEHEAMKRNSLKSNVTKSQASGSALREISMLRNKDNKNYNPGIIKCLKYVTELFIILILILLGLRITISVTIGTKIVSYSSLMYENGYRIVYLGITALMAEQISLMHPIYGTNKLLDDKVRMKKYDYNTLLRVLRINGTVNDFNDYVYLNMQNSINLMRDSRKFTDIRARNLAPEIREIISPSSIPIEWIINDQIGNVNTPLQSAYSIIIANAVRILDNLKKGTYSNDDYMAKLVISNALTNIMVKLRPALDIIVKDANDNIELTEMFSLITMLVLIGIYTLYLIILIPFLWTTSRDLESMLMMFMEIKNNDIKHERDKALKFKRKLYRESKKSCKELETSGDENLRNTENAQDEENEESINAEINFENSDKKQKKNGRKQKKQYTPYQSNVWQVLLLFGILSGCAIAIYFVLDYFAKQGTVLIARKIIELRYFSRNSYANAYSLPYLYNFIMSNKTGVCGTGNCRTYLPSYFNLRLVEITELMRSHKGNESLLDDEYRKFYNGIIEGNICENTRLREDKNCTLFMGGILKEGWFAANFRFADLTQAIFYDFEKAVGTVEDIRKFVNDERLIDLEVLNVMYLDATTQIIMNEIIDMLPKELQNSITKTVILMSVFIMIFITTTIWWLAWLLGFMKGSIFETKSLLTNLPDDVILKNKPIYKYLASASVSTDIHNS